MPRQIPPIRAKVSMQICIYAGMKSFEESEIKDNFQDAASPTCDRDNTQINTNVTDSILDLHKFKSDKIPRQKI